MVIQISEIKEFLKVEDSLEDVIVQTILDAAISYSETYLNRPILDANMTVSNTWAVPAAVKMAIYLLCSHWYENRNAIGQVREEVAFSVTALLTPYRFINI